MKVNNLPFFSFFMVCSLFTLVSRPSWAQNHLGSGNMVVFDGVDDRVDLGAGAFSNLALPVTIMVWVKPQNSSTILPVFSSSEHPTDWHGIWLHVRSDRINAAFADGTGGFTNGSKHVKQCPVNNLHSRWAHVAAVIRGPNDIDVYLNGNAIAGNYSGNATSLVNAPNGAAHIGFHRRGGTVFYRGEMDELSLWNRALSLSEIRNQMCRKYDPNATGLLAAWDFNDALAGNTLSNLAGLPSGTKSGGIAHQTSTAPVGDRSHWSYNGGSAIEFSPNLDSVVASPQGSGDQGIHLYFVDSLPVPQPANPSMPPSVQHYAGVFMADPSRSYDLEYHLAPPLTTSGIYGLSWRSNNASTQWNSLSPRNNPVINLNNRSAPEQLALITACPLYDPFPTDTAACDSLRLTLGTAFNNITWDNGSPAASRLLSNSGTYWVQATDANGCPVVDTIRVQIVNTENIDLLPEDTLVCGSGSVVLNAFGPNIEAYQWSNGSTDSATAFFTPGIKWVQVFYGGGCSVRDSVLLRLSPEIDPLEKDTFLLCENQAVPLSVSPLDFINVLWSNGSSNFSTSYNTLGQHWVQAEKDDGCLESDTFYLLPGLGVDSLQLFRDTLYCVDEPFVLRSPDPSISVFWPNGSDSIYLVNRPQTIRVELSDGCRTATEFFTVEPINCACDVVMPDAFTPNGDGLNDDFGPVSRCVYLAYELEVFNRWGSLVFRSKDPQERFDGTLNGEALAQGVYVYRLRYQTEGSEGRRRGAVHLLR